MTRLPRSLPSFSPALALACALALPASLYMTPRIVLGQDAPAADAAPATSQSLEQLTDDFWHYGKIARYDLAADAGNKIIAQNPDPQALLSTFRAVAESHKDNLDQWMLRWQGVDAMRDVTTKLLNDLNKGQFALRSDQKFIEENIQRLAINDRAFSIGLDNLRQSGELAYPLMISYLRDASKKQYHYPILKAMRELGRVGLNPLVATTNMKDEATLISIVQVLGDLGYDAAVPYLVRLAQDKDTPAAVRSAATDALARMGAGDAKNLNAADLFYALGEKFYYNNASITYDNGNSSAYVWSWDEQNGLTKKDVPPAIFHDIMAMRETENAFRLNPKLEKAVSLWLASDYKREAELPAGDVDPTRPTNDPGAHFYGVSLGTRYLNDVVHRALTDQDASVALRSIKSLEQIVGQSNLFAGGQPIIAALQYPDRQVRFEAAFTLAAALPQKSFADNERVVPILAEALSQNGKPNVLVIVPADKFKAMTEGLKTAGYEVAGGSSVHEALAQAATLPAVDVILFSDSLKPADVSELISKTAMSPRLRGAGMVVLNSSGQGLNYAPRAIVTNGTDAASIKPQIEEARAKTGGLPLDEKTATQYALRSAELLSELAINRNPVLDVVGALPQLLAALDDSRPEVITAAANVLGHVDSPQVQPALLAKGADAKATAPLQTAAMKSLAANAKAFGNRLNAEQVATLQKVVQEAADPALRNAAAEARGALNLSSDLAQQLILGQPAK